MRLMLSVVPYMASTFAFDGTNGQSPQGAVARDTAGDLFGVTSQGGDSNGDGTVFELPAGGNSVVTFAEFDQMTSGSDALTGLIIDKAGNLYGTTGFGATNDSGAIFEIVHGTKTITPLAAFDPNTEPVDLVVDRAGNLFGVANNFIAGNGSIFELPAGSHSISTLATFNGGGKGQNGEPEPGIVIDSAGNIFGATEFGGASGEGSIYELPAGASTILTLASFSRPSTGAYPTGGVARDRAGNIFGTCGAVGMPGDGTIYELPSGTHTVDPLASFQNSELSLVNRVTLDSSDDVFGTTNLSPTDPAHGGGGVFELPHGSSTISFIASFPATGMGNSGDGGAGILLDPLGDVLGITGDLTGDPVNARVGAVFDLVPQFQSAPPTLSDVSFSDSGSVTINQTQRSEVRNLILSFSEPVTLANNAFALERLNIGGSGSNDDSAPEDASAALGTAVQVPGGNGAQWSIPILQNTAFSDATGSLTDGIYDLNVDGAAVTSAGMPMVLDVTLTFHRLFGDITGGKTVNNGDYLKLKAAYLTAAGNPKFNANFDYDGNGQINNADFLQFKKRYLKVFSY